MSVQGTSIICYNKLKETGKLSDRQILVYKAHIDMGEGTDREIANFLGFKDPNMVRPRRKDLVDMGLVKEIYKRNCNVSKELASVWEIVSEHEKLLKPDKVALSDREFRKLIKLVEQTNFYQRTMIRKRLDLFKDDIKQEVL